MNVLYVIDPGTVGGATIAFVEMILKLKELGIEPLVLTGQRNSFNDKLDKLCIKNIPINHQTALVPFTFKTPKWPIILLQYVCKYYISRFTSRKIIKDKVNLRSIDIIHTNSARNDIGCWISKEYGIPHICHIREFGDKDFSCIKLLPNFYMYLNNYSTCFIAISNAVRKHWISKGISKEKVKLVYDGVSYEDIHVSSDSSKENIKLKIIMAGGIVKTKGQHLAVEALLYLPDNIRDSITIDFAGWCVPRYKREIMKFAKSKGLDGHINFLGPINDVHKRLGDYQIGLTCSRAEGFGLVTAEYMHAQLGVIASDSGACPELIDNNINGLLFKSGDARDLARCIELYFNNRNLLIDYSNSAKRKATERFTSQRNANQILEVYKTMLNEYEK